MKKKQIIHRRHQYIQTLSTFWVITDREITGSVHHREDVMLEVIVNGRIRSTVPFPDSSGKGTGCETKVTIPLTDQGSRWVAVRVWEGK